MFKKIPYRITGITGIELSEHESILILFSLLFVNIHH